MVSFIVIGDPHFKIDNVIQTEEMEDKLLKKLSTLKLDFIVILGDTLDRHESIHVSPLNRSIKWLNELTKISFVYLIIGNHDLINNKQFLSTQHPFQCLKNWKNIKVIDSFIIESINDYQFGFVPYVPNGKFMDAIQQNDDWKDCHFIFCHQEFKGVKMGHKISDTGDLWDDSYPNIISGHIHDYQKVGKNILYTGSLLQHGFSDIVKKTISYFELNDNQYKHTKINLHLMKKRKYKLTIDQIDNFKIKENEIIKIEIIGHYGDIKSSKLKQRLKNLEDQGCKITFTNNLHINEESYHHNIEKHNFDFYLYQKIEKEQELYKLFKDICQ